MDYYKFEALLFWNTVSFIVKFAFWLFLLLKKVDWIKLLSEIYTFDKAKNEFYNVIIESLTDIVFSEIKFWNLVYFENSKFKLMPFINFVFFKLPVKKTSYFSYNFFKLLFFFFKYKFNLKFKWSLILICFCKMNVRIRILTIKV